MTPTLRVPSPASPPAGRSPSDRPNPAWLTSDLLDRVFVAILVLGPILMIVANRVVDGAQAVYDINGNAHVIGGGGLATRLSGVVAMGAAIVVSVLVIARGVVQRRGAVTPVALIGLLTVVGTVVRREDTASLLDVLAAAAMVTAAGFVRVTPAMIGAVGRYTTVVSCFQLFYTFVMNPAGGLIPCRDDKCTPVGGLMQGIFWAENSLAVYATVMLPTIALARSRAWRVVGLTSTLACIYLTGSRVGYLAALPAVLAYLVARRLVAPGAAEQWDFAEGPFRLLRPVLRWVSALPIVMLLGSIYFSFTLSPTAWTFRGDVYRVVLLANRDHYLLGAGLAAIQDYFHRGHAIFLMGTEHGEFPHLLNRSGILAVALFALCLVLIVRRSASWEGALYVTLLVGPGVFLMTESTVTLSFRNHLWPMFLIALACVVARPEPEPRPAGARRARPPLMVLGWLDGALSAARRNLALLVGLPVAFALAAGVAIALAPPTYQASAQLFFTVQAPALRSTSAGGGTDDPSYVSQDSKALAHALAGGALAVRITQDPSVPGRLQVDVPTAAPSTVQLTLHGSDSARTRQTLDTLVRGVQAQKSTWSSAPTTVTALGPVQIEQQPRRWATIPVAALVALLVAALWIVGASRLRTYRGTGLVLAGLEPGRRRRPSARAGLGRPNTPRLPPSS